MLVSIFYYFFFQAEDGIRDYDVTGVQTCALPIYAVIADVEFRDAVDHRVEQLLVGGPHALAAAKRLIAEFEGGDIESQLEAEAEAFARCCDNEESTEGATAFLEKRPPQWS